MSAPVFPLHMLHALHQRYPNAKAKRLVEMINRAHTHEALWLWWLEDQIGRIIDQEFGKAG